MFGDMMGKLSEMKRKVEEAKERLDRITVQGEAGNGRVKVIVTGNRLVKSIELDPALSQSNNEELQHLVAEAVNNALAQAKKVEESEMQSTAKGVLPNIPGLG